MQCAALHICLNVALNTHTLAGLGEIREHWGAFFHHQHVRRLHVKVQYVEAVYIFQRTGEAAGYLKQLLLLLLFISCVQPFVVHPILQIAAVDVVHQEKCLLGRVLVPYEVHTEHVWVSVRVVEREQQRGFLAEVIEAALGMESLQSADFPLGIDPEHTSVASLA